MRSKSFRKKKQKKIMLEIVLITLFYNTTDVYPINPPIEPLFYTHLFLLATICENVFESLLIYDQLCESVFLSIYENKQAYEYHYLKQIFYHQNMKLSWNASLTLIQQTHQLFILLTRLSFYQ